MLGGLKYKKSAGVRVTAAVHRSIRQGNSARDRQDWHAAITAYRAALEADPSLRHIRIQLGHVLKEGGRRDEAIAAYEAAAAQRPEDPEPSRLLGHLAKSAGDRRAAAIYYADAVRAGDEEAVAELHALLAAFHAIGAAAIRSAVREPLPEPRPHYGSAGIAEDLDTVLARVPDADRTVLEALRDTLTRAGGAGAAQAVSSGVVFDVTDFIGHVRHHRLPTGIQRVQIEVIARALRDPSLAVRVCCYTSWQNALVEVPAALFLALADAATAGADSDASDWQVLLARLAIDLVTAEEFAFEHGDRLVNLGTSWWIYDYFRLVRNAKRDHAITYIPFVHDLIPLMAREYCVTGVVEDYLSWLIGVFDHADGFLVNSESTGRDLVEVAARLGRQVDPETLEVVPLDADFRRDHRDRQAALILDQWKLEPQRYCLLVSTIEARKNHVLALDAWARLIETHGGDALPRLVCVGRKGWLNDEFYERLRFNPALYGLVTVIDRVSDGELAQLYEASAFTVYPSHYEGWGLPVTESLCYGKVPVVAANSSLTEAGGNFAVYFETDSISALAEAVEAVWFDADHRARLEAAIADRYRPRSWATIAAQVIEAVTLRWRDRPAVNAPAVRFGLCYPVSHYKGVRVWPGLGSGEIYRVGRGWLWPETDCARTTPDGGDLAIPATTSNPLRLYLRLRGLTSEDAGYRVTRGGETVARGNLTAGEERWVLGDLAPVGDDGVLALHVRGDRAEEITMMIGGAPAKRIASIAVTGFALVERDDEDARARFLEQVALGGADTVDAYAEPGRNGSVRQAA